MIRQALHSLRHNTASFGFSVIELLFVLFIVGTVGIAIMQFSGKVSYFNRYFSNSISVADRAQKLLRPMGQEIRSAAQSNSGSYAIDTAQANDFIFYSDIDNDGLAEKVRYYLSGTNLIKEVTKPTGNPYVYNSANKVVTTPVTAIRNTGSEPIFNYYDSSYTGGTDGEVVPSAGSVTSIRLVRITLHIDVDTNMPPPTTTVTTLIGIRNLKQQL